MEKGKPIVLSKKGKEYTLTKEQKKIIAASSLAEFLPETFPWENETWYQNISIQPFSISNLDSEYINNLMSSESLKTPIKGDNDEHTTSPPTDPRAWSDSGNVPCLYVRDRHTKDTMVVPETPDDVVLSMDDNLYPISTYSRRRKLFQSPSRLGDIDEKNISKRRKK